MDKISVIVPVYNAEKYLPGCLNSILKQTFSNLEIILVDDGAKDSSGAICDKFAVEDDRIRVIHKTNAGVSAARNDGLQIATGDWVSFVDSDDELEPDMYEFLLQLAKGHNAQIAHCGYKRLSENGDILKEVSGTHQILVQKPTEAIECMLEGRYFVGGLWNKLFSRKILENLQFATQLKNNEDILFNALAFQNAETIVFADETKYRYFEHDSSACNQLSQERQLNDATNAANIFTEKAKLPSIKHWAEKWQFLTRMNLYRFLVFSADADRNTMKELHSWLEENKSLGPSSFKGKCNYLLIMHFRFIYKIIYRIYDAIRKPDWDARKN